MYVIVASSTSLKRDVTPDGAFTREIQSFQQKHDLQIIDSYSRVPSHNKFRTTCVLLVHHRRPDQHLGDAVRVTIGRRTTVLQVPEPVLGHGPRDAHAGVTVGHAGRELVDRRRFVQARQTALVVSSLVRVVHLNVTLVLLRELLDGRVDDAATRASEFRSTAS